MKNKLLVSVFAVGIALAFTACETKSSPSVTEVCTDLLKESIHKSARSLAVLDGEVLTMEEYEFPGGANDNRLLHRIISFGNGVNMPKRVDSLTYEYGEWKDQNTAFTLIVHPKEGESYQLVFRGNTLVNIQGRVFGGEGLSNTARVEKWEKTIKSLSNTKWNATFKGEYVMDSIFIYRIDTIFIPPMTWKYDTVPVFDHLDTLSADTACYYALEFKQDATTNLTTGHYYCRSVRSTYDRETKKETIVKENIFEYDYKWFFSDVSSDAKFMMNLVNVSGGKGDLLNISKYKTDDAGKAVEFLLNGLTFTRDMNP